jgi:hypothetical protein
VVGHGGGISSFNTLIQRVPEDRHLVVLLNNTGGTNLGRHVRRNRRYPVWAPAGPGQAAGGGDLRDHREVGSGGRHRAIPRAQGEPRRASSISRTAQHRGIRAPGAEAGGDAVEIFKLNVELFPQSGNVYDSLAEAHMKAGQKELAIRNYAKALELDPTNRNAVDQLATLMK